MVHRCWAVNEIVRAIVEILVRDGKRASAVALASCCKSLEEPALGGIWRRVSSLVPLVKCFPPDVWEIRGKERKLHFKRAPTQAEWVQFQKRYASKVQYLRQNYHYPQRCLSSAALHVLQLYSSSGPLLPNLMSLDWISDEKHLPFVSLFISPSLTSIEIHVHRNASPMLPPILKSLSKLPNILNIEIDAFCNDRLYHDTSMEEASSQMLMQCNYRLRKFRVDSPISASALRHVIQLPSLEDFWLVVNSIQLPDPLPTLMFPSLRELDVECNGDFTWLKLLPSIGNPVLTNIGIKCPGSDVERFIKTFQKTMTGCGMHESLQVFVVESPDKFQITPRIIAHNLSFKNLTTLDLSSECSDRCQTSALTDDDIDLLTKAMPCLRGLSLGGSPCMVPSQITFKSLYTISRRCTLLTDLLIHFNPAQFVNKMLTTKQSWEVALGLSDLKTHSSDLCTVKTIYAGNIPLPPNANASSILALGLLGVFPCLRGIENEDGYWDDIYKLVRVYRRMGCYAFGQRESDGDSDNMSDGDEDDTWVTGF